MKLSITKDGNQFCVLYGEDLQVGIAGFGETEELALKEFSEKFLLSCGWMWGYCHGHGDAEPCSFRENVIADIEKTMVLIRKEDLFDEPVPYDKYF